MFLGRAQGSPEYMHRYFHSSLLAEGKGYDWLWEREDIVSKLHALEKLQNKHPYRGFAASSYWERVDASLAGIPKEHADAALCIFSNVFYLGDDLLEDITRLLVSETARWLSDRELVPDNAHIFAVDHPELTTKYYQYGDTYGWQARMDHKIQLKIDTCSQLLERLAACAEGAFGAVAEIREILQKKVWIVITDNCLSGYSAQSDLKRLTALRKILCRDTQSIPPLVLATQTISDEGIDLLAQHLRGPEDLIYGLRFNRECKLNDDACAMFNHRETLVAVRALCEWFGRAHFSDELVIEKHHFGQTLRKHRDSGSHPNFAYGWRDGGYAVVSVKNSPTNSIPLLWYPETKQQDLPLGFEDPGTYQPPFPRNQSRRKQNIAGDDKKLAAIVETQSKIREKLW